MSAKNKVPAIRFHGFTENWEDKQIQDLIDEQAITSHLDGNHGELYPRSSEFSDDGIPYIAATDFADGLVNFKRCKYLPIAKAKQFKKGIAKNGDILFAHNATVGPVAKLITNFDFVILSTTATYFRCDNNTLFNDYLLQALSDVRFIKQYSRVMSQSTRNQVPITAQRTFFIPIPKEPTEQTKIGHYFQQLDTLIAQHQQKHDKLLNLKKSLLEKMFPKQGEKVPEIRFKGFSGEWEEKEIQEVCNKFDNLRIPITAKDRVLGTTPYYGANGIQDYVDGHTHDGEFILVAEDGANDLKNYPTQYVNGKVWVNNHAHVLQSKTNMADNYFLKVSISRTNIEPFLVGGGRAKLNAEVMMKISINVPHKVTEQGKIGNLFRQLDTLLNQHEGQLRKLKNIKMACLEKMFV